MEPNGDSGTNRWKLIDDQWAQPVSYPNIAPQSSIVLLFVYLES